MTAFPTLVQAGGTKQKRTAHKKSAFVFALKGRTRVKG